MLGKNAGFQQRADRKLRERFIGPRKKVNGPFLPQSALAMAIGSHYHSTELKYFSASMAAAQPAPAAVTACL